jgi:hypothetical protein
MISKIDEKMASYRWFAAEMSMFFGVFHGFSCHNVAQYQAASPGRWTPSLQGWHLSPNGFYDRKTVGDHPIGDGAKPRNQPHLGMISWLLSLPSGNLT